MILRGMLDPHVHLRDLDWSHKATFTSETRAALAGGYWMVWDMPNTQPSTVDAASLQTKMQAINAGAVCDWALYLGAATSGNWADYAALYPQTCGLKIYNNATTGDLLIEDQAIRAQHYRHWPAERVIAVHAEGETVAEILALVRQYRKRTHFCHISTAYEIKLLTAAKEEGLPISIGVTPHHLFLCEDDLGHLGAFGRMKPELKTRADCAALWEALNLGIVDVVESDHAPHTRAEKESAQPPYGVPGLETTLPLMLMAAHEGRISQERVIELLTTGAHRAFKLTPPPETYTLVDPEASYIISGAAQQGACDWTPFEGMRVRGKVREVWIRGQQVYDGEGVLVEAGFGQNYFA